MYVARMYVEVGERVSTVFRLTFETETDMLATVDLLTTIDPHVKLWKLSMDGGGDVEQVHDRA